MLKAYIGFGSNLGNPVENLREGLRELRKQIDLTVTRTASIYMSEPIGYTEQEWFANSVVEIETSLEPLELLRVLQSIEAILGRQRIIHWGPRTLDLDMLLYGQQEIHTPELDVPHPEVTKRAFVAVPLAELAPDYALAGKAISVWAIELMKDQKLTCLNEKL